MDFKTAPSLGWTENPACKASLYKCPHKPKFLTCKECAGNFCARCIQLEVHYCPNLETRAKNEKVVLSTKLVKVVADKVLRI